jgi:TonB-linked SusC/RagA family outer membrane protein
MRKMTLLMVMTIIVSAFAHGQLRTVTGKVVDPQGKPIPFATISIKGTTSGVAADANGSFSIQAARNAKLEISATSFQPVEINIGDQTSITVTLSSQTSLSEVVVTALGIRKTRNQLSYSAQQISGTDVNQTRATNFLNSVSGKVSGLEIRQTNTLGGSVNAVIRGAKSMVFNNQALFVIDGVPYDNSNNNTSNQVTGRGGYDYGNAASDINPDDIESITVLKGAAASALYGSRGANGVIMITTKRSKRGLGITINSGVTIGRVDKKTFTEYQKEYGGGYGRYYEDGSGYFLYRDIDGDGTDDLVVPVSEDASYGGKFDPGMMVYQWDAFDPTSPNFGKARPWVAAANDPTKFFETATSSNQSVFIDGATDKGSFKIGYTRNDDKGILPNSKIIKNLVNLGATYNINEKLTAGASLNYANVQGKGRYGTGYDDKNMMTNFRQWWQVNVDVKEQKEAYFRNKKNVTWNWADPTDLTPIYWDNPYFTRYENYENDTRNRYFGYASLNYKATEWLNVMGRVSIDNYDELQEERQAKTSVTTSQYQRTNNSFSEINFDLLGTFDKDLTSDINLKALLGTNLRKQHIQNIYASTNGGLIADRVYSLSNSLNPINAPTETNLRREIGGVFGGITFTWKDMVTLEGTIRRDASSTLPDGNNAYYYPSISGGFVFSKLLPQATWLSYGKLRANYAQVGADAPIYKTLDVYNIVPPFGSSPQASVFGIRNNPDLKPEETKSYEIGLELAFLKNRAGLDISYYSAKTFDQILPVTVSTATGYSSKFLNAGTMQNKGIEISAYGTPVKTSDFSWTINANWTRNRNKVIELFEGADNLLLATFQGGISLNATLKQPYPTIRGTNFIFTNGQPTVGANGRYLTSPTSNEIIGNANTDWIGGINNTLKYKDVSLSFLVDVRKGGDVFSLDLYYGLATGLYPETAGLNDLGNPSRNTLANGGGIILPGVKQDGKANDIRHNNADFGIFGYRFNHPAADFVYDAGFVKLREVILTYSLPKNIVSKIRAFKGIDLSLIGRNLWIIDKNLPYSDPEEAMSSGNLQGYQGGAYPTVRTFAFNIKLNL